MTPLLDPQLIERLSRLELFARRAAGGGAVGERAAGAVGVGTTFREHRTYSPGDDLRYVDWNAYGRLRSLHVKMHEREENLDVHLLLDRSASMCGGDGWKLATAQRVGAVLGTIALTRAAGVRIQLLPSPASARTRSFRGRAAVAPFLDALRSVPPGGSEPLGQALRRVFPRLRRRGVAVLVSDFLDEREGERGWRHAVEFLAYRKVALIAVHVVAPAERNPGVLGAVRLRDSETGEELDMDVDARVAATYRERFATHVRGVEAFLRRKGARHVVIDALPDRELSDAALIGRLVSAGVVR